MCLDKVKDTSHTLSLIYTRILFVCIYVGYIPYILNICNIWWGQIHITLHPPGENFFSRKMPITHICPNHHATGEMEISWHLMFFIADQRLGCWIHPEGHLIAISGETIRLQCPCVTLFHWFNPFYDHDLLGMSLLPICMCPYHFSFSWIEPKCPSLNLVVSNVSSRWQAVPC